MGFTCMWINEDPLLSVATAFLGASNKGVVATVGKTKASVDPIYKLTSAGGHVQKYYPLVLNNRPATLWGWAAISVTSSQAV